MKTSFKYAGIGARVLPDGMADLLTSVASNLESIGWHLYTGGAEGADKAFMDGINDIDMMTVFIPWDGFNGYSSNDGPVTPVKTMAPSIQSQAYSIAEEYHPNWGAVSVGAQPLMARNSFQVLGPDLESPVDCVICWTIDGKVTGGTGQALRIARGHGIPIINLGSVTPAEAEELIGNIIQP